MSTINLYCFYVIPVLALILKYLLMHKASNYKKLISSFKLICLNNIMITFLNQYSEGLSAYIFFKGYVHITQV